MGEALPNPLAVLETTNQVWFSRDQIAQGIRLGYAVALRDLSAYANGGVKNIPDETMGIIGQVILGDYPESNALAEQIIAVLEHDFPHKGFGELIAGWEEPVEHESQQNQQERVA